MIKITSGFYNAPCVVNYVLVWFQVLVTSGLCCIRDISPGHQTCLRFRSENLKFSQFMVYPNSFFQHALSFKFFSES